MNKNKAWEDLLAIIDNLEDSIKLYRNGRKNAYRQTAIGLRTLLCDNNCVLKRVFPTAALHPLNNLASKLSEKNSYLLKNLVFNQPGCVVLDEEGNVKIENLFYKGKLLLLDQWLIQPLINQNITIKEFITSVADKEGKHSDPEYNETLNLVKSISLSSSQMHPELIITIGEYVSTLLRHITSTFFTKEEIQSWLNKPTKE